MKYMRILKRIGVVILSIILSIFPIITDVLANAVELSDDATDITIIEDFNLYTYRADLYLEDGTMCNGIVDRLMTYTYPSDYVVEQLDKDLSIQLMLKNWRRLNYVSSPSEILEGGIDKKGYYTAIILSVFKSQMNNTVYLDDISKQVASDTNYILSRTKSWVEISDVIDLDVLEGKRKLKELSVEEKEVIADFLSKEFKEQHPLLEHRTNIYENVSIVFDHVSTLTEGIELMEAYIKISEISESMKNVLMEMYQQCSDFNLIMKNALYEAAIASVNLEGAVNATIANVVSKECVYVLGYLMDKGWENIVKTNLYAMAFTIGFEIGNAICNTLYSTDKTMEQYEKMGCLRDFIVLLRDVTSDMGHTYMTDKTTENASNYFACIDALFASYSLSCDFTIDYTEILYNDTLVNRVWGNRETYEVYTSSIKALKDIFKRYEKTIIDLFLKELSIEHPDVYEKLIAKKAGIKSTIAIGDYITLGSYLGEPITWRCVDIDENGPLMLSDKILCFKSFDAKGNHNNYYRDKCGTNNWKESCLRRWLNSAGTVDWSNRPAIPNSASVFNGCNPYSDEQGFLSSFSKNELEYVKHVKLKTNINDLDEVYADGGFQEYFEVNGNFSSSLANSETMGDGYMYQNTMDYFFCLDYKQAGRVYRNLGANALLAYPTHSAVANDDSNGTKTNNTYRYWMRVPATSGGSYECVQAVAHIEHITTLTAVSTTNLVDYQHVGVRPAFYLDLEKVPIEDNADFSSIWDGVSKTEVKPVDNVYLINHVNELAWLAKSVNAGQDFSGYTVIITGEMDLNNREWTPIGQGQTFNGNLIIENCDIYGLYSCNYEYAGLFGRINFKSLYINNLNINSAKLRKTDDNWTGNYFGSLVGYLYVSSDTKIEICNSSFYVDAEYQNIADTGSVGTVIGAVNFIGENAEVVFENNYYEGNCYGYFSAGGVIGRTSDSDSDNKIIFKRNLSNSYVKTKGWSYDETHSGGYIGYTDGGNYYFSECSSEGTVYAEAYEGSCGGFIGHARYKTIQIENSLVTATIFSEWSGPAIHDGGGFFGYSLCLDNSDSYISNCYFAGQVNTASAFVTSVDDASKTIPLYNCYFDKEKSGISENSFYVKSYRWDVCTSNLYDCKSYTTGQMKDKDNYNNWDFESVWDIEENKYPYLDALKYCRINVYVTSPNGYPLQDVIINVVKDDAVLQTVKTDKYGNASVLVERDNSIYKIEMVVSDLYRLPKEITANKLYYYEEYRNEFEYYYSYLLKTLRHDWESEFTTDKSPSYTEAGYESMHCRDCDATINGREIPAITGMALSSEGKWCYYTDGEINSLYTGMAKNDYGLWYINKGELDRTYTGMYIYNGKWIYVNKGKYDISYTGMAENSVGVWYMKNGNLDRTYTGMYVYNGKWIYVNKGKYDITYTGMAENSAGVWYMKNGNLDRTYTGMYVYNGKWIYVNKGKYDITYTGMAENSAGVWYMKNGNLDRTYTGMYVYNGKWIYVNKGKYDISYTGMAKNSYGWWYIKDGNLDRTYTGLATNSYGTWYMKNGNLDTAYNGSIVFEGSIYTIKNGMAMI